MPEPAAPRLVLASSSPRRRALLDEHGFAHHAVAPGIDDGVLAPGRVPPAQWVAALAYLKARAGWERRPEGTRVLVAADTVVVKDGRILGQPSTAEAAGTMVRLLAGGGHRVLTGVALLVDGDDPHPRQHLLVDGSAVELGPVPDDAIDRYIASGGWAGKAGGYNLADRIADGWPITYRGDASSIMGLPMARLGRLLEEALASRTLETR